MNDEEPNDVERTAEANIARLIEASYGPEARPRPEARAALFRRLAVELQTRRGPVAFPEWGVALLLGLVLVIAALVGASAVWNGHAAELPRWIAWTALIPLSNLAAIPIAALIIVIRRRKWDTN